MKNNFKETLKEYCDFLKKKKLWSKNNIINYEFQIEKLYDWKSDVSSKGLMKWFLSEQKKKYSRYIYYTFR
jgi:site-specific recombinase XerC